jgi:alpha-glucosidase
MQWKNAPQAGFCPAEVRPWLPVNPNYAEGINVSDQAKDPESLLSFHRQFIQLRRSIPALVDGQQIAVQPRSRDTLAFLRQNAEQTVLVLLHFKNQARRYPWKAAAGGQFTHGKLLYSLSGQTLKPATLTLAPFDIAVIALQ